MNLECISDIVFEGLVEQRTTDLCFCKLSWAKLIQVGFFFGLSRAKHGIVELAFRSHCDSGGLVDQLMVFIVFKA